MIKFKVGDKVRYVGNRTEHKGKTAIYAGKNGDFNKLLFLDGTIYTTAYDKSVVSLTKKVAKKTTKVKK